MIRRGAGTETKRGELLHLHDPGKVGNNVDRRALDGRHRLAYEYSLPDQAFHVRVARRSDVARRVLGSHQIDGTGWLRAVGLDPAIDDRPRQALIAAWKQHRGQPTDGVGREPSPRVQQGAEARALAAGLAEARLI